MLFTILIIFLLNSFNQQPTKSLEPFHWLEGTWKLDGKESFEKWTIVDDTLITGIVYHYEYREEEEGELEKELRLDETMLLVSRNNKFFYIARVANQNGGEEIVFEVKSQLKNSFSAFNPTHDFPQQISYELKGPDRLHAYISGTKDNQKRRVDFNYTRSK